MALIQTFFPTSVYIENKILSDEQRIKLQEKTLKYSENVVSGGKEWKSNVKNNHGYSNLNDDDFKRLEDNITQHVNNFAMSLMSDFKYTCNSSWYNIYDKNSYQEYHVHTNSIFSAVYFLSYPDGSSPLVFSSEILDMFPMKNILEYNFFNSGIFEYHAEENSLVIFRSNIRHMVPKGENKIPRITLSYNFS
jgi:uncharacterized protein (TIGR02466 family)